MYKGYIKVSKNLILNYSNAGMSMDEVMFLLQVLSHKKGYILTDDILGIRRAKACKIRKHLKELGIMNYYTEKNVGTKYYISVENLRAAIGDKDTNAKKEEVEEVIDDGYSIDEYFSSEEIDKLLSVIKTVHPSWNKEDLEDNFDVDTLKMYLKNIIEAA